MALAAIKITKDGASGHLVDSLDWISSPGTTRLHLRVKCHLNVILLGTQALVGKHIEDMNHVANVLLILSIIFMVVHQPLN